MGNLQSQVNAIRNEMKDHRAILISLDGSVKTLEATANTVGFLPSDEDWAVALLDQADGWRTAVKERREADLISPEHHIGSTLVGQMMQLFEGLKKTANCDLDDIRGGPTSRNTRWWMRES